MDTYNRNKRELKLKIYLHLCEIISQSVEYFKSSGMLSIYLLSWN